MSARDDRSGARVPVRAVVFDMGNTLLEFETIPWEELNRLGAGAAFDVLAAAAARAGIAREDFVRRYDAVFARLAEEAAPAHAGLHLFDVFADLVASLGLPCDRALAEALTERHYVPILAQVSLYPETDATLRRLRAQGLKLGIVSNTIWPSAYHVADLRRFGIAEHFDSLVFSTDVGVCKPHPRIFARCLEELGVAPAEAVFVGDRPLEDVGGAQRAGMRGILKAHPLRVPLASISPDGHIRSLAEIVDLVSAESTR